MSPGGPCSEDGSAAAKGLQNLSSGEPTFSGSPQRRGLQGGPLSGWEAAAANPWSPRHRAFPPVSGSCNSPSSPCPPRSGALLSAARCAWPCLLNSHLQTIFVLSFHQLLTSDIAGAPGPTCAQENHHLLPKPDSPFSISVAGTTCRFPLTCLIPGPSASFLPPPPTPVPSTFLAGIRMHFTMAVGLD